MNKYSSGDAMRRRQEILRIVGESAVHSQDELLDKLRAAGFQATQPTLSRDIRELGLAKTAGGYTVPGTPAPVVALSSGMTGEARAHQAVRELALSVDLAGNLVILRTPPAEAQPLALAIDQAGLPGVVGSIAGDDTIFVAVRTSADASLLAQRFRDLIHQSRSRRTRA